MLYLVYILIGLLIILLTNLAVTACLALKDMHSHRLEENLPFVHAFKKYFGENNNIPVHLTDWKF